MKRGDIKNEQLEKAMNMERPNLQDIFQEILFPNTLGKSLLAGIKKIFPFSGIHKSIPNNETKALG